MDGNVSLNNKILSEVNDLLDEVLSKKRFQLFDNLKYVCYNVAEMAHYSSRYNIMKTRVKYR